MKSFIIATSFFFFFFSGIALKYPFPLAQHSTVSNETILGTILNNNIRMDFLFNLALCPCGHFFSLLEND